MKDIEIYADYEHIMKNHCVKGNCLFEPDTGERYIVYNEKYFRFHFYEGGVTNVYFRHSPNLHHYYLTPSIVNIELFNKKGLQKHISLITEKGDKLVKNYLTNSDFFIKAKDSTTNIELIEISSVNNSQVNTDVPIGTFTVNKEFIPYNSRNYYEVADNKQRKLHKNIWDKHIKKIKTHFLLIGEPPEKSFYAYSSNEIDNEDIFHKDNFEIIYKIIKGYPNYLKSSLTFLPYRFYTFSKKIHKFINVTEKRHFEYLTQTRKE